MLPEQPTGRVWAASEATRKLIGPKPWSIAWALVAEPRRGMSART